MLCEIQLVSSRIWTRVAVSNSYEDNHFTTGTSFSYIDELYDSTFVKDLGSPNHFFWNLLIKHSIFSTLQSDTSYIYIGHAYLGIKPK